MKLLDLYISSLSPSKLWYLARTTSNKSLISYLALNEQFFVKMDIASNRNTPIKILKILASNPTDIYVKRIAENRLNELKILKEHKIKGVI